MESGHGKRHTDREKSSWPESLEAAEVEVGFPKYIHVSTDLSSAK